MTAPVGSFSPNPWGLYDTAGNVVEWVLDDFQRGYLNAPVDGGAHLISDSIRKVQRGGSWDSSRNYLGSAVRDYRRVSSAKNDAGFRLVLEPGDNVPALPQKK